LFFHFAVFFHLFISSHLISSHLIDEILPQFLSASFKLMIDLRL
jgi:hypothetical protein